MILSGLALAAGIASSAYSSSQNNKAVSKIENEADILEEQHRRQEAFYNKKMYEDITDRAEIQSLLNRMDEQSRDEYRRDNARATNFGSTTEERIADADSRSKSYADTLAGIASNASMLHDGIDSNWLNSQSNYYANRLGMSDKIAGIYSRDAQNWAGVGGNAFSTALGGLADAIDLGDINIKNGGRIDEFPQMNEGTKKTLKSLGSSTGLPDPNAKFKNWLNGIGG